MKVLMHRIVLLGGIGVLVMAAGTACTLTGANAAPLTPSGPGDFMPEMATPTEDLGFLPTPDEYNPPDVFGDLTSTVASDPFAAVPTDENLTGESPTGGEPVIPDMGVTPALDMTPVMPMATATPFAGAPVDQATPIPIPPSADGGCPSSYTVQSGDTLFRIALRFGLTVQELASANGITNPDSLPVGTVLSIPGCGGTASGGSGAGDTVASSGDIQHVVQPGENLFRIALQYGLDWETVAAYNGITNPNNISVGQVILIPNN